MGQNIVTEFGKVFNMTYYSIADLIVSIDAGHVTLQKELKDFEISKPDRQCDIDISFDFSGEDLKFVFKFQQKETWIMTAPLLNIFEKPDSFVVLYKYPKLVYGYEVFKSTNKAVIYFNTAEIDGADTYDIKLEEHEAEDTTGPELLLYSVRDAFFFHAQKFGRIPIHSSSIIYKGKVYIFSASSGVGKTTHVSQWSNAEIEHSLFNGDVCMAYQKDGYVFAGALPWSGTSNCYTAKDYPLGGVIFIQRGEINAINPLGLADGAINLCARCLAPNWNRSLVSYNMDIIEEMIPKIITGKLQCNISSEAAIVVRDFLEERR